METARKKRKACWRTIQGAPQPEELRDRAWDGAVRPLSPSDSNKEARGRATGHLVVVSDVRMQVVDGVETRSGSYNRKF